MRTLVETEKQLFSNSHDHTTWVSAALLQIASEGRSNGIAPDTVLTEFTNPAGTSHLNRILQNKFTHSIKISSFRQILFTGADTNSAPRSRFEPTSVSTTPYFNHVDGSTDPTSEKRSSHALDLHTKIKHINMEEVWHDILERIDNKDLGEFLHSQAKLISLTLSRGYYTFLFIFYS